jgi:ketosteroid isomerase-like protein
MDASNTPHDGSAAVPTDTNAGTQASSSSESLAETLADLLAERDIRHTLARFATVLDTRAWDRLNEVYAPDGLAVYGEHRAQGYTALEKHFRAFLGGCGPSQHLLGNIEIHVTGTTATSRAAVCASHRALGANDPREFIARGNYHARWQRLPVGWRIAKWEWENGWFSGDYSVLQPG